MTTAQSAGGTTHTCTKFASSSDTMQTKRKSAYATASRVAVIVGHPCTAVPVHENGVCVGYRVELSTYQCSCRSGASHYGAVGQLLATYALEHKPALTAAIALETLAQLL
jgi:hypothetical protein